MPKNRAARPRELACGALACGAGLLAVAGAKSARFFDANHRVRPRAHASCVLHCSPSGGSGDSVRAMAQMDAWPSAEAASSQQHARCPLPECIPMAAHASCPSYATIALLMCVVHVVLAAAAQYGNGSGSGRGSTALVVAVLRS